MKKFFAVVLALICLMSFAVADTPSKETKDLITVTFEPENKIPGNGLVIEVKPLEEFEKDVKFVELGNAIIKALSEAKDFEEYFGELRNPQGEVVTLEEIIGEKAGNVNEFNGILVANYDEALGKVTVQVGFTTPYEKDEKVAVLIGAANTEDGTATWTALEGTGLEDGSVEIVFEPETLTAIQEAGHQFIAVVSK